MTDLRRCALLAVVVFTIGAPPANAQRFECEAIQPGDTAASLALRIAGNADRRHESWFQIFDPAASTFIAKTRYDHIRPGWVACISDARNRRHVVARAATIEHMPRSLGIEQTAGTFQLDARWYFAVLLLTTPFAWRIADRRWKVRQAAIEDMSRFGVTFINEFERPLVQPRTSLPATKSKLRFKPHCGRLEVLLAPAAGRSYPNLSDHRHNVEYDVERVLRELRNQRFVGESLRQHGQWVVVPFRVKTTQKMEGPA
jgi:hypothetical protein